MVMAIEVSRTGTGTSAADVLLLLGRVGLAAVFVIGGFGKITGFGGFAEGMAERGLPLPTLSAAIGTAVEFLAGLALGLGLRTRWAAAGLLLFTIAATLIAHAFWTFDDASRGMQQIQFMKNLAIAGGLLIVMAAGGGGLSLDRVLDRRG
jgi:putative oxidoreductase